MIGFARRFLDDDKGATALEYGLVVGLISIVVVAAATIVFNDVSLKFNKISNTLGTS